MHKIKLFWIDENYSEDQSVMWSLRDHITDWEEVSNEDYRLLQQWKWKLEHEVGQRVVIVEQDPTPVVARIKNIRDWLAEKQREKEQQENKRIEQAAERARKKGLKQSKREIELLKKLQEKYPDQT